MFLCTRIACVQYALVGWSRIGLHKKIYMSTAYVEKDTRND